jgi:formylglycine-generating enzyme required for sulfatase activity/dienelactone hydrolase
MDNPELAVEELFGEALALAREQRSAFLERACRGEPDLRLRVESLLAENDRLSGFLSKPAYSPVDNPASTLAPQVPGLKPGCRIGRYSIKDSLGAGGMGIVYRARDEKLERDVAVKILSPGMLCTPEAHRHFQREALALARLNHPNIADVYDAGEQDGIDFIVMELVEGESLAARLHSGALQVSDATSIVLQVAEALEEAHVKGVIHRDLKPANVMITRKGHAKVLDFGLAKLLSQTVSIAETHGMMGTPLYMSPEQALGKPVDARTDLWSLGAMYYETLAGKPPFSAENNLAVLRSVIEAKPASLRTLHPRVPAQAERIVWRALEKDPSRRYQSAAEFARDARELLATTSAASMVVPPQSSRRRMAMFGALMVLLAALAATGFWLYRREAEHRWAREEAIPQIHSLVDARKPLTASLVLAKAEKILPDNAQLRQLAQATTQTVNISSDPLGATVQIQDYFTPKAEWLSLGTTPLHAIRIPKGYFRWKIAKQGLGEIVAAPETDSEMNFALQTEHDAPAGMSYVPAGPWATYNAFIGWIGPYKMPAYYVDRFEVTNREYQKFVDSGAYSKPQYWPAQFRKDGHPLSWSEAMSLFRDSSDRPGPSTWAAGHYPQGHADLPVSGISWYEAQAYATYAGKSLPTLAQWYQDAPGDVGEYTVQLSNLGTSGPAAVGSYQGVGPYGTYDMGGNVREWVSNSADSDLRFILGGSWMSPDYLYSSPEALSAFDRSSTNGIRCVRNPQPLAAAITAPVQRVSRDFSKYKPVSDDVFRAYELLYAYSKTPLNAKSEGIVHETADWREEKVSFDAAYNGERMSAYLFLPKRVQQPYQTVLFFPSARVLFLSGDSSELGDVKFFDYILQSGRAVMYPVYKGTYERRGKMNLPGGSQDDNRPTEWYKDAARTLDYLDTRPDIDHTRMSYLGVSMGSANGVIFATLLQNRLKTALFLDGGYFLATPMPGVDQADFAPRLKIPVLMVNGKYDYTFPVDKAQDPLFRMLGTPPDEKSHVILDTPHDVTEQHSQLVSTVLGWLDHYLGRVQ